MRQVQGKRQKGSGQEVSKRSIKRERERERGSGIKETIVKAGERKTDRQSARQTAKKRFGESARQTERSYRRRNLSNKSRGMHDKYI